MKTPLTYWGGKQLMVPHILPMIPEHEHYVEPFCGGAAIFFAKPKSRIETLNDKNGALTNFYRVLQNERAFGLLQELLNETCYSEKLYHQAFDYYEQKLKEGHQEMGHEVKWAWSLFVGLSMGMFSKLERRFRLVKQGATPPYGTFQRKVERLKGHYVARMKQVQILSRDAVQIIRQLDYEEVFFYLDPPYIDTAQGHYKGYTKQHYEELLEMLSGIKGTFLLSSFPSEPLSRYAERNRWYVKELVLNKLSAWKKRTKVECLTSNYEPGRQQGLFFGKVT